MAKSKLRLVKPATENRTVPLRRPNAELRTREYLTDAEVARLMKAASANRWGHRDATMILTAYRHGFRAAELVDLRWDTNRLRYGNAGSAQGQARIAGHAPGPGRRASRTAPACARARAQITVCVHQRARCAVHHSRVCQDGGTGRRSSEARLQGASAYAAARDGVQACE
jgi:site-specific recombinase XerD